MGRSCNYVDLSCVNIFSGTFRRSNLRGGGLRLPRIIGMLFTGIILGPHVLGLLDDKILSISSELRQMALIIILLKKYRMWAIMSAKYAVSGRRFHQGRFISLS